MRATWRRMLQQTAGIWILSLLQAGCAANQPDPTVILISFDGFGWDYLEKADTPNLDRLIRSGVRAKGLIPVFPTETFPNHYTIVTGLYPETHGVVGNAMYDPELRSRFRMADRDAVEDGRWWGGEPIWVTLARAGKKSATFFWPGSEAQIHGFRPTYWERYRTEVSQRDRIDRILAWLDLPERDRPVFMATYFAAVDVAGHRYGPDSPEVVDAIEKLDATIGHLIEGLERRRLFDRINLILVSDHGMASRSPDQVIFLDDYVDLSGVHVVDWTPVLLIRPEAADEARIYESLRGAHPHLEIFRREEVPERLHFRKNSRIPPIVGIADEGWTITTHAYFAERGGRLSAATHGYDNRFQSMQGIFIAQGPAFREGLVVEPFLNLHVYSILVELLGVQAPPNEADLDLVRHILAAPAGRLKD